MRREKFVGYQMPPDALPEPEVLDVPNLTGGLNRSISPDLIEANQTPFCKNVVGYDNVLAKRKGVHRMGSDALIDQTGNPDSALHIVQYWKFSGSNWLVALNTDYLYYWDFTIDEWVYGEDCTSTPVHTGSGLDDMTAGVGYNGYGTKNFRVQIDAAGAPDTFKWSDDGGSTWEATGVAITGSAQKLNNGVTITFGATSGHTLDDRWDFNGVQPSPYFTGGNDDYFSTCVIQDVLCIANGVDKVKKWDGSLAPSDLDTNCPPARYLCSFADRLFLGFTEESGSKPMRIKWSVSGDITDWTGTGSGYYDLLDSSDWITGLQVMGGSMVIFKEESIYVANRTGIPQPAVRVNSWVDGVGCYSPRSILNIGDEILFMSLDPVIYSLSKAGIKPISDLIAQFLLEYANPTYLERSFAIDNSLYSEYWLFIADAVSNYPNQVFAFNYDNKTWWYHDLAMRAGGYYQMRATYTFDNQPPGDFDSDVGSFDDREGLEGFPTNIFSGIDGKIYEMDGNDLTDDGLIIQSEFHSKDLTDPRAALLGGLKLIIEYYADSPVTIKVEISRDGGVTYSESVNVNLLATAGEIEWAHCDFIVTGHRLRFRISDVITSGTYRILKVKPKLITRGEHFPT